MPIYEYVCSACGDTHELLQKIGESAPRQCPSCAKEGTLGKLMSRSAFHFKGGGWYKDLYASAKPKQKETKQQKTESGEKADSGKTESVKKEPAKADSGKKETAKAGKKT